MRYALELVRAGFRIPHKVAQSMLLRDMTGWIRVEFIGTASGMGLISALSQPRSSRELAERLEVTEPGLLDSFLELGAALGELRRDGDRWRLRGVRARALTDPSLDGMSGMLEEAVSYDGDVYRALRRRLNGEPPGDYLSEAAETVARASRLSEIVLTPLVRGVVRRHKPARVLDIGCGTGIYLRAVADSSSTATGVGVDVRPEVVRAAERNLSEWNIAGRFTVRQADARRLPPDLSGPWDLVLLFQNIYYFAPGERPALLARLRALVPNGVLVVATAVADAGDPLAGHLDIVLRSTSGNYPLPTRSEVRDAMLGAGFTSVRERRLAPRQPIRAFVGS